MNPLALFFDKLSDRFYKENDLSDITTALLLASCPARNSFFKFISIPIPKDAAVTIEREVQFGDEGRIDIVISAAEYRITLSAKYGIPNIIWRSIVVPLKE